MDRIILGEKVYYYENAIKDFNIMMDVLEELTQLESDAGITSWLDWTASNDKEHIYGKTKMFGIDAINQLNEPYKSKSLYIYNTVQDSFYNVCKDYAEAQGDTDEPNLFPVFNIKKYNPGSAMGAHFDQLDGDNTLRYSLVMYLNDDYEGGEISFKIVDYDGVLNETTPHFDYDIALKEKTMSFGIKPKAGSIIVFPSSAPYHHVAHIIKSGFKYMVPGHWIHNNMEMHKGKM
jgi:hypothetical protein